MASPATSRPGGYLGERRLRISLVIAVIEGLLVIVHVIPRWAIFIVAVAAVAYWAAYGRSSNSVMVRQASWIFAASQVFVILVPLLLIFFSTVAYVALAILAIVALIFLFTERDHQT
jgi:hypothetical protein